MMSSLRIPSASTNTPASSTDAVNEKELNWHKACPSERASSECGGNNDKSDDKYSKAQQAHKILLQQIRTEKKPGQQRRHDPTNRATLGGSKTIERRGVYNEVSEDALELNENEHLLGGQKQQQVIKRNKTTAARKHFKGTQTVTSDTSSSENQAGSSNEYPANPLGNNNSFIGTTTTNVADFATTSTSALVEDIDLKTDCKLESHEFPKEMTQSENNTNEHNGSTIILTPTLLTRAIHGQTDINGGDSDGRYGGGAGGCVIDDGVASAAANVSALNDGIYKGPRIWQYLVKHYPASSQPLAILLTLIALWVLGYTLMPDYAAPHTAIMRLIFLIVGAQIAGVFVMFLKVPDMLGMLFFGVLYTNVGLADFTGYQKLEAFLREMALINIMLLAGLGLDASAFRKLWFMILRLTLIPTTAEVAVIMILAHFLLNMSWLWGILLGLVITAVSPNVVVTIMLKLKEERLGLNSGIHTLIYAMTACNDVVSIFLFGVLCGVIFSTGSLTEQFLQGPIGIGIGIVFGYVYGVVLQFVPSRNALYANGLRFVLTVLGGTIAVMGSKVIGYPSAGALGCVTISFIAGIGWKRQEKKMTPQQKQAHENASVAKRLDLMWKFLKPVSFSLIGKEINFELLDGKVVGYGALLILLGSMFRLAFAYLSTYSGNLTRKERGYITISGLPKATVQAALGPIALDLSRSLNANTETLSLAHNVLIISVLAIIFTAPLGAILMLRLAPLWLQRSPLNVTSSPDNNCTESVDSVENNVTPNFWQIESASNDGVDRNQKSV